MSGPAISLKTETLAIVLTDIAGYPEPTQNQSRLDNARLLNTHNRILYPIIRRYKGRHVKSIGDALLLVFRSPTDAMLCAMAMQDALFEFNRNSPKDQQIHIRVAASLGEVRVTRNDVFGEAVNVTSRIESITPVEEIYPCGGAHLIETDAEGGWRARFGGSGPAGRVAKLVLAGLVLLPLSLLAVFYGPALFSGKAGAKPVVVAKVAETPVTESTRPSRPEVTTSEAKPAAKPATKPAVTVAPEPKKAGGSPAGPPG